MWAEIALENLIIGGRSMSKIINELPCEYCEVDCPGLDLEVKVDTLYTDTKIYDRVITLECKNESLCKYIRENNTPLGSINK